MIEKPRYRHRSSVRFGKRSGSFEKFSARASKRVTIEWEPQQTPIKEGLMLAGDRLIGLVVRGLVVRDIGAEGLWFVPGPVKSLCCNHILGHNDGFYYRTR